MDKVLIKNKENGCETVDKHNTKHSTSISRNDDRYTENLSCTLVKLLVSKINKQARTQWQERSGPFVMICIFVKISLDPFRPEVLQRQMRLTVIHIIALFSRHMPD